jgi:hypothetical protein
LDFAALSGATPPLGVTRVPAPAFDFISECVIPDPGPWDLNRYGLRPPAVIRGYEWRRALDHFRAWADDLMPFDLRRSFPAHLMTHEYRLFREGIELYLERRGPIETLDPGVLY